MLIFRKHNFKNLTKLDDKEALDLCNQAAILVEEASSSTGKA